VISVRSVVKVILVQSWLSRRERRSYGGFRTDAP